MKLYATTDEHEHNNRAFLVLLESDPDLKAYAFQPSPQKAPWHWQVILHGAEGLPPYELSFWPHVAKANLGKNKSVQGWENIRELVEETLQFWREDHARDK